VELAVTVALQAIDDALGGSAQQLPSKDMRRAVDGQIKFPASTRVASFFLLAYSLCDANWDFKSIPRGIRGKYGDKRLANELSERHLTLHDNITAFGENLGWKGNVANVSLAEAPRFKEFIAVLRTATPEDRHLALHYFASRFAESRRLQNPLPPLPDDTLSFARARVLFQSIAGIQSEGHIQQFLVAGLLRALRSRVGDSIKTHHPHAADKFDGTAGDIEEFRGSDLIAAYEVTVRSDWKNRLQVFRRKMADFGLKKYWIIASDVYDDAELSDPADMLAFLEPAHADIAVVDLGAFIDVFLAELSSAELRHVVNDIYADLVNPKLSGRQDFIDAYGEAVGEWLDSVG
jgi:hypothetical protein